ncbi:MAG: ankyrin repeat domain-containing protein [Parachlamydiales bacterium]|nr:ankyrin repeat domain-containing protein [Parachlamydiales bacterium]
MALSTVSPNFHSTNLTPIPILKSILKNNDEKPNIKRIKFNIPDIKPLALHDSLNQNNMHEFKELILRGAPINEKNKDLKTPLMVAVDINNLEAVKLLIQNHCDLNSVDKKYNTALHLAVQSRSYEIIKVLIESKAKFDIISRNCCTPRGYAVSKQDFKTLDIIPSDSLTEELMSKRIACNFIGMNYFLKIDNRNIDVSGTYTIEVFHYFVKIIESLINNEDKNLKSIIDPSIAIEIIDALNFVIDNGYIEKNYLERIRNNLPVIFPSGWKNHFIATFIYKNYFGICNAGQNNLINDFNNLGFLRKFKTKSLDLDTIIKLLDKPAPNIGRQLIYDEIPLKLATKKNNRTCKIEKYLKFKKQHYGNCGVKNLEIAIRYLSSLINEHNHDFDDSSFCYSMRMEAQSVASRHLMTYAKLQSLNDYSKMITNIYFDSVFFNQAFERIKARFEKNCNDAFYLTPAIKSLYDSLEKINQKLKVDSISSLN